MNQKITIIILMIALLLSSLFADFTWATIGPVHVELNITSERLGASRANTANSFKIYMRINKNIEVHDLVHIWLPTYEASWNPDDICGDPMLIKGFEENPRFVPNEKYFEEFDNKEELEFGKLYSIIDDGTGDAEFFEPVYCDELSESCRLRKDSSGLGYWIMGSVLPAIPRDSSHRKDFLFDLWTKLAIGYNCGCGGSYPIIKQTKGECRISVHSDVGVEAWRQGYNPIDFNISKSVGVISPATPGRYKLRVATEAEPTPVESDSFVLPCSQISNLKVDVNLKAKEKDEYIKIDFDVGEGGALDAGNSLIRIVFPESAIFPAWIADENILVNGTNIKTRMQVNRENHRITVVSPVNVENLGHVQISILKSSEIRLQTNKEMTFKVDTSSEPEPVIRKEESEDSEPQEKNKINSVKVRFDGQKSVAVNPANSAASFKIFLNLNKKILPGDWIKLWFPVCEAKDNLNEICGVPTGVTGNTEDPRFIPNESYYSRYPDSAEKNLGKLYEVNDDETGEVVFYNESCHKESDCNKEFKTNTYGYYLSGTVFPPLPRNKDDYKERLRQILHSISIGYNLCSDCQGYPIIKQTCNERSIQFNSHSELDPKSGYNPIDISTSKATGIITPMTPGRYRLKAATKAEPTPVESEAFFLSCSSMEVNPKLDIIESIEDGKIFYRVVLTTGIAGSLDEEYSSIYIGFPEDFSIDTDKLKDSVTIKTESPHIKVEDFKIIPNTSTLMIQTPIDIENNQMVEVRIPKDAVNTTAEESFSVFVCTSSETKKVYSNFINVDSKPKKPKEVYSEPTPISNLKFTSNKIGDETGISFTLDAREKTVSKNSEFRVNLPDDFYIPEKILKSQFMINSHPVKKFKRNTETSISLWLDTRIIKHPYQLRFIDFDLQKYAKIRNPKESGKYTFKIFIDGASETESESFEIVAD